MKLVRKKRACWIFILVFSTFIAQAYADGQYQLIASPEYIAFSGDLHVQYTTPNHVSLPNAYIRLVLQTDGIPVEITNLGMDSKYKSGSVKLTCGVIEVAGNYEFQMYMYAGGQILTRLGMIVRWPKVVLQLPESHIAQTDSVHVEINSEAACIPILHKYKFHIHVEYAANTTAMSVSGKEEVIFSKEFSNFTATKLFIEFPCSLFDIAGLYRVSFKSSFSAISVVSRSNVMITSWSSAYSINIWRETLFPCSGVLEVHFLQPSCPGTSDRNKIRVYMLRRKSSGSLAAPLERSYVQELPAMSDASSVTFGCAEFQTAASSYCFVFVTVSRNGAVINQTEKCLPAHADSVLPIDGGWSAWSEWAVCSSSCGRGQRSRYRMCDTPTPDLGGAFCAGDPIQWRSCQTFCPESIPMTPLHSPNVTKQCACGCNLHHPKGEIIASGRCQETSRWLITAPEHHNIKLHFTYLKFFENKQWVKVRNGGSLDSDLIAFSDGRDLLTHVISSSSQMLVEFYSESSLPGEAAVSHDSSTADHAVAIYPMSPTRPIHVYGFIATYTSNVTSGSAVAASPVRTTRRPSIWESTVAIVGIALCGLTVITALSFALCYRACHKRHHKYAMAAHDESPVRMCKSTSMPSSPSHESHHGIEIEHDMDVPLTGKTVPEIKKVYTPGSVNSRTSIAGACSNNFKKLRTKVEIEYTGGGRSSPLTPHKDYSPLRQKPSPHKQALCRESNRDSGNMSLFRTSPLLNPKVQRSPKVHPSSKGKKSTKSSLDTAAKPKKRSLSNRLCASPEREKGRKRPEARSPLGDERVVMGADLTPTAPVQAPFRPSLKSPLSVTSPQSAVNECVTPTNLNSDVAFRHKANEIARKNDSDPVKLNGIHNGANNDRPIVLKNLDQSITECERNPASGTSDDSNTSAEKDADVTMTTSFIENETKPRRPVSLTESYSKSSIASFTGKNSATNTITSAGESQDKASLTSSDDRQNALPKPDGQSPKSPRIEMAKASKSSTPRSVRSVRSDTTDASSKTKSPARSINTPELEYDDFIDYDDTYSYFDPLETEKLTWHGVEKVGTKTPSTEK